MRRPDRRSDGSGWDQSVLEAAGALVSAFFSVVDDPASLDDEEESDDVELLVELDFLEEPRASFL